MPVYKSLGKHKLLLDTHVWIWLMMGEECLSLAFKRSVQQFKDEENILISIISIWELGMLVERKKIQLEIDCLDWVDQTFASPNVKLVPITPRIAIDSTRLPEKIHGDPADRILIATARENNAILVTHDQKILEYGKSKFIGVYDPCKQ